MASLFPAPTERRYAQYPRRWGVEYHCDGRRVAPTVRSGCATLTSARTRATKACDQGFCTIVRIFDHMTGEYKFTYKASAAGVTRYEGYVK